MAIAASRSRASAGSDEAIACYERALALRPQAADTHNNLGVALKQQGKLGEAIAHFEAALALASSYAEAHLNLAAALLASADQLEAQRHVLAALALKETLETLLTAPPAVLPRNRDRPGGERRRPRRHARICRGARPAMLDQRICLRRDR